MINAHLTLYSTSVTEIASERDLADIYQLNVYRLNEGLLKLLLLEQIMFISETIINIS